MIRILAYTSAVILFWCITVYPGYLLHTYHQWSVIDVCIHPATLVKTGLFLWGMYAVDILTQQSK